MQAISNDPQLGGAVIVYAGGQPVVEVSKLNNDVFYSRYTSDYDLLNFWVGLRDGKNLLDNPPPSEILGYGYGDGQIYELIQEGLLNLNVEELYMVRSAVDQSISETVSMVQGIHKQLPSEQIHIQDQLLPWKDQLTLLDTAGAEFPAEQTYLTDQLDALAAQEVVLQAALGDIEDILGQSWPTLPGEEARLGREISVLTARQDTLAGDYGMAVQQEDQLLQMQSYLTGELS